ncbi:hypothetical protein, variant 2 [Plasmodium yoelii 17X]|uniref:J domain-containing protein n=1 Tax=Plasmodium yoelii 17X TaxID=1323249 RepID=V7PI69_PLAYE|nr:hypothetical protein, variant 2 [Plasmodium yoelii 17X]
MWPIAILLFGGGVLLAKKGMNYMKNQKVGLNKNFFFPSNLNKNLSNVFLKPDMKGFERTMSKSEAYKILNINPTTNRERIREVHKQLMLKNHPDNGEMKKLYSKNLSVEELDELIKNEEIKYEYLKKENEKIKEKNLKIQKKLLNYVECDNFTCENNKNYNLEKYNIILESIIDYINKLKAIDTYMKNDIYYLFDNFFYCIKEAILKQNSLCQLMKNDMSYFNVPEKSELFRKNLLTLRKINEHNSILRARIFLFNKFKEKNENLIHANFEQLELKYKNLKGKENILESKIQNLNNKIKKSTEVAKNQNMKKMKIYNNFNKTKIYVYI